MPDSFYFYKGRIALHAILRAMGIGPSDEVVLQAFTCLAVPLPIIALGAVPVYVDIRRNKSNMDLSLLSGKITPKTKAIIVQHTFGIPADMEQLCAIARARHLYVIEDCCHSLWTRYHNKEIGSFGDAAFFSYEWGKPVIAGVGGSCIINNPEIEMKLRAFYHEYRHPSMAKVLKIQAQRLVHSAILRPSLFWILRDFYRLLGRFGLTERTFQEEELAGTLENDRLRLHPAFQAIIELKLRDAALLAEQRKALSQRYDAIIGPLGLQVLKKTPDTEPVLLRYPLYVDNKEAILRHARHEHVELGDWFVSPIHPLSPAEYRLVKYKQETCPESEMAAKRIITLPMHEKMNDRIVEKTSVFLHSMKNQGLL
jgi:dTDP-4-amino-4,6-dideoxygalactose transaminase